MDPLPTQPRTVCNQESAALPPSRHASVRSGPTDPQPPRARAAGDQESAALPPSRHDSDRPGPTDPQLKLDWPGPLARTDSDVWYPDCARPGGPPADAAARCRRSGECSTPARQTRQCQVQPHGPATPARTRRWRSGECSTGAGPVAVGLSCPPRPSWPGRVAPHPAARGAGCGGGGGVAGRLPSCAAVCASGVVRHCGVPPSPASRPASAPFGLSPKDTRNSKQYCASNQPDQLFCFISLIKSLNLNLAGLLEYFAAHN